MENQGVVAKQIARWVALGALFLVTLVPLIVANSFFFPFITGKAFFFRILVEIAFAAWVLLAFLDAEYRPRFSWIGVVAIAFVAWMGIADLFALNVTKAFWSNFERMEGWVLLIHLLGFFFAASSVLRVEKRWRSWFLASLAVSVVVSIHALLQLAGAMPIHQGSTRIDSSFGNSAYFAIYLLFNVFIAGWLALTEKRAWLKWSLVALAVLEGVLVFFTETRGTVLGLTGALVLAGLLTAFTAGKRARRIGAWGAAVVILLAGGFYLARDSSFVQGNHVLERIASISLRDGATRFTIWGMAFEGIAERPIVGWGQEGFNYVFNQFYKPSLYQQEPWFDRAHDVFIDWLVEGGIPAFVLYLALYGSLITLLWTRSELSRAERIALTAAVAGYACHNLFVFDNLYSYIYFFAILAFVDSQVGRPCARLGAAPELSEQNGMAYGLPLAALLAALLIWSVNVPGMNAATELITAITPSSGPEAELATFEDLVKHPAFAAQEVREQLVSFASSLSQDTQAPTALKQAAATLAVTQMQKQVAAYPQDARERLQLAYAYHAAGDSASALTEIEAALKLSPGKESIWIQAGATEWDLGDVQAAAADFDKAYALGPEFQDLAAYAAAGDYAAGSAALGDTTLKTAYGTTTVDSSILAVAYYRAHLWPRLLALWQLRVVNDPSLDNMFGLAAAYYAAGQPQNAVTAIKQAVARYPEAQQAGDAAIKQVESGPAQ